MSELRPIGDLLGASSKDALCPRHAAVPRGGFLHKGHNDGHFIGSSIDGFIKREQCAPVRRILDFTSTQKLRVDSQKSVVSRDNVVLEPMHLEGEQAIKKLTSIPQLLSPEKLSQIVKNAVKSQPALNDKSQLAIKRAATKHLSTKRDQEFVASAKTEHLRVDGSFDREPVTPQGKLHLINVALGGRLVCSLHSHNGPPCGRDSKCSPNQGLEVVDQSRDIGGTCPFFANRTSLQDTHDNRHKGAQGNPCQKRFQLKPQTFVGSTFAGHFEVRKLNAQAVEMAPTRSTSFGDGNVR
jgi:hypothetical protein